MSMEMYRMRNRIGRLDDDVRPSIRIAFELNHAAARAPVGRVVDDLKSGGVGPFHFHGSPTN